MGAISGAPHVVVAGSVKLYVWYDLRLPQWVASRPKNLSDFAHPVHAYTFRQQLQKQPKNLTIFKEKTLINPGFSLTVTGENCCLSA